MPERRARPWLTSGADHDVWAAGEDLGIIDDNRIFILPVEHRSNVQPVVGNDDSIPAEQQEVDQDVKRSRQDRRPEGPKCAWSIWVTAAASLLATDIGHAEDLGNLQRRSVRLRIRVAEPVREGEPLSN